MNQRMKPVWKFAAESGGEGGEGNDGGETPPTEEGSSFTPVTTQDDLNKIVAERVNRERAKYADYKDLKAKAAKYDEAEEATKTEVQKAADRATAAERERDEARAEMLRFRIASQHGITDADDIDLFLTATDEETLTKQAKRLADRETDRKKRGNVSPREGTTPPNAEPDAKRAFLRTLTGGD